MNKTIKNFWKCNLIIFALVINSPCSKNYEKQDFNFYFAELNGFESFISNYINLDKTKLVISYINFENRDSISFFGLKSIKFNIKSANKGNLDDILLVKLTHIDKISLYYKIEEHSYLEINLNVYLPIQYENNLKNLFFKSENDVNISYFVSDLETTLIDYKYSYFLGGLQNEYYRFADYIYYSYFEASSSKLNELKYELNLANAIYNVYLSDFFLLF